MQIRQIGPWVRGNKPSTGDRGDPLVTVGSHGILSDAESRTTDVVPKSCPRVSRKGTRRTKVQTKVRLCLCLSSDIPGYGDIPGYDFVFTSLRHFRSDIFLAPPSPPIPFLFHFSPFFSYVVSYCRYLGRSPPHLDTPIFSSEDCNS